MPNSAVCSVCGGEAAPLDVVDFNKSCEEARGKFLQLSGIPVYYYICNQCEFCFAPKLYKWTLNDFSKKIYNDQYIEVDPDYKTKRPEINAANLVAAFKGHETSINHLDYGGGNGLLSDLVGRSGWKSSSYDPSVNHNTNVNTLGKFNLITAYEVFEHVPDVNKLASHLSLLLDNDGIILFSTLLSDGNIAKNQRLNWWYASPRNGHISLFSKRSLTILAKKHNFNLGSFSPAYHLFYRQTIPDWAAHIFKLVTISTTRDTTKTR